MSLARVAAIAGRIFTQFRRDHRTLALILVVPIVVMSLVGYLLSERREPVNIGYVNADRGGETFIGPINLGMSIDGVLRKQPGITVQPYASADAAEAAVRSGEIVGAVLVPDDLTERVLAREPALLGLLLRGIEPVSDNTVRLALRRALAALAERLAETIGDGAPGQPVTIEETTVLAEPGLATIDYYGPSFIVAFAFFFTFLLTSVSFLRERATGTIERLTASPATRLEVVVGYLSGFLFFALIQSLVILGYSVWVLNMRVAGPIGLALLVLGVLVVGVVNLGIALSFFARNELQVVQFIPLVFLPQVLLAGLIWPVETLHPVLRTLAQVFPLTHALAALRTVMIGGGGLADIQDRLLVLLAFAAAMIALGAAALQKQKA
ncbi:MAG: ABC transporter permease [Armatimonadetes bacterium]|nr:ABC transporter permease [Armatimonadota bacterium]